MSPMSAEDAALNAPSASTVPAAAATFSRRERTPGVRAPEAARSSSPHGYDHGVAEQTQTLDEQLKEIGAQLAWVRDYL
jgi:hypothetical protein